MEKYITINNQYNSLDALYELLKKETSFECSKEYDIWEQRTDENGQMAQCIVIKKSSMHAIKLFLIGDNAVKVNHIIPNKMMQAYFGKSVKARRSIFEVIIGKIMQTLLASSQQNAFDEMEKVVQKAA